MDYNKLSYYRANPFAENDFIQKGSMVNRKRKQFISQMPQGQDYLPSKPGKRIFRDKVVSDQIQKDNILNSPQRYPYQNRIALDKNYRRNLDTIDIQGASSGTKVSESIRNKHKAIQQLRRRNNQDAAKSPLIGQSLDEVYEKKRRQIAQQIQKNLEIKKTKEQFSQNLLDKNQHFSHQNMHSSMNIQHSPHLSPKQLESSYDRYVAHNSNQKYNGVPSNSFQFQGFQRYKRPEKGFQTLDHYNYGRIPEEPPFKRDHQRYQSIDRNADSRFDQYKNANHETNLRGSSIDLNPAGRPIQKQVYSNNSYININNRHRSNPQYVQNYPSELQKRIQQVERNKQIESNLRNIYEQDRVEFRRNNPTNLSFNIAAKNSLMGPIV